MNPSAKPVEGFIVLEGHKGDGSFCAPLQAHGRPWFLIPIPQKFCAPWIIIRGAQKEPSLLCPLGLVWDN